MNQEIMNQLSQLLDILGLDEEPMGMFYSDTKPEKGFSPKPSELPTREKELKNEIDWQGVFQNFSCALMNIWLARKKKTAAYFSAEKYGCPGGAFWLGFNKPQSETIIHYVSTGIPDRMEGEFYCDSPQTLRKIFNDIDPIPAPRKYCIFKPINNFAGQEKPDLVTFFARPEALCGLHQLAAFVTNDPEVVVSPWSAACGSLAIWPMHYLSRNEPKAVIGGWDPSARKFFKTDEISFTVPMGMFNDMVNRFDQSFLMKKTWSNVRKKIDRSKKVWGEE